MIQTSEPRPPAYRATLEANPAPPARPAFTWKNIHKGRLTILCAFVGACAAFSLSVFGHQAGIGGNDATACRKVITGGPSVDDQYLGAIHAAKAGSAVESALYAVYGQAAKGNVTDSTWARLSQACAAVGVNL